MDLWVVAAATGAGYLAKYLQNSAGEKEKLSESLSQIWDQTWPFCRLAEKGSEFGNVIPRRGDDVTDGNCDISDILTLTSLLENVGETSENTDFFYGGDVLHELESNQLKRNGLLRSRRAHGFSIEPVSPLESRLVTRLNKEKIVKRDFIFSPPLPSPAISFVGPLIVNQIINGDTSDSIGEFLNGGDIRYSQEEKNELLGCCLSRQSGLVELPRTRKHEVGKGRLSNSGSSGTLLSQGPLIGIVLFFAGITIGIISSVIANKKELDNVNAQLKQKENLIQDLHEEIEMSDRVTLKEVSNEDNQSRESTNRSSDWELVVLSSKHDLEESTKHGSKNSDDQNVDDPELMSKIEAELEAELEKLDLNISSSGLERKSDYIELDPDFEADVVRGDLKIHEPRPADASQLESKNDASGTWTNHTSCSNYTVSPWELSLRLHKVIESRLEARIEELEQALRNSRKRHSMEWLRIISSRGSETCEVGSSSTPETQTYTYEVDDMDPPLVTSFSGEASDAYYNEAYEEIFRMIDSDEETPYST